MYDSSSELHNTDGQVWNDRAGLKGKGSKGKASKQKPQLLLLRLRFAFNTAHLCTTCLQSHLLGNLALRSIAKEANGF